MLKTQLALSVSLATALGTSAVADTIHITFDPTGGDWSTVDTLSDGLIVSAGVNGTDTWNVGSFASSPGAITDLKLASGADSGASLSVSYRNLANLGGGFDIAGKPGANDDFALFDGVAIMDDDDGDSLTISNLSSMFTTNGYTVTLYTSHGDTRAVTFDIDGNTTSTQQPSAATFNGDATGFTGTIAGLSSDSFTLTATSTNGNRYFLAGLTITAVPEPGSLALLGLGGLMVARRRRG